MLNLIITNFTWAFWYLCLRPSESSIEHLTRSSSSLSSFFAWAKSSSNLAMISAKSSLSRSCFFSSCLKSTVFEVVVFIAGCFTSLFWVHAKLSYDFLVVGLFALSGLVNLRRQLVRWFFPPIILESSWVLDFCRIGGGLVGLFFLASIEWLVAQNSDLRRTSTDLLRCFVFLLAWFWLFVIDDLTVTLGESFFWYSDGDVLYRGMFPIDLALLIRELFDDAFLAASELNCGLA